MIEWQHPKMWSWNKINFFEKGWRGEYLLAGVLPQLTHWDATEGYRLTSTKYSHLRIYLKLIIQIVWIQNPTRVSGSLAIQGPQAKNHFSWREAQLVRCHSWWQTTSWTLNYGGPNPHIHSTVVFGQLLFPRHFPGLTPYLGFWFHNFQFSPISIKNHLF